MSVILTMIDSVTGKIGATICAALQPTQPGLSDAYCLSMHCVDGLAEYAEPIKKILIQLMNPG